eukprot:940045-Amphidinium_carterae.2
MEVGARYTDGRGSHLEDFSSKHQGMVLSYTERTNMLFKVEFRSRNELRRKVCQTNSIPSLKQAIQPEPNQPCLRLAICPSQRIAYYVIL